MEKILKAAGIAGRDGWELYCEAHDAYGLDTRGQLKEAIAVASDVLVKAGVAA